MVIDKPAGLPVDTPRRGGDSVVERLGELKQGFQRPPTPMHRLDQDTSGCLLLARSPKARSVAAEGVRDAAGRKILSRGRRWRDRAGRGDDRPRARQEVEREGRLADGRRREGRQGDHHWRKLEVRDGRTLVEFRPVTGRTHQLRVHAREAFGRGIVGDRVYGVPGGPMLLHASRLVVPREKKAAIDVSAPLPDYFGDWGDEA